MPFTKTESEILFEELCSDHNIPCREVPRGPRKTPDYSVRFGTQPVIAEVKQLEPGEDEQEALEILERTGRIQVQGEIGKKVRQEITDSKKQIKLLAKDKCPGLLVLYNTAKTPVGAQHTDPMFILTAMYGHLLARIRLPSQPDGQPTIEEMRFGGRRMVTEDHNTSISAVCVLYRGKDSFAGMNLYHNAFAAQPFDPELFRSSRIRHYRILEAGSHKFEHWQEL